MAALKIIAQGSPSVGVDPNDIAIHLPSDAQFDPTAGEEILATMAMHSQAVAVYWDIMAGDQRQARPAWSPTRVLSEPGVCLPLAVRASWPHFDPSCIPLEVERRLAESNAEVLHIPSVLTYHPDPASSTEELMPDDPRFEPGPRPGTRRLRASTSGQASTSIIIPSAGYSLPASTAPVLFRCLETLALLNPLPLEVIVVIGDEYQAKMPKENTRLPVRVVNRGVGPFEFSKAINCGLLASRGEFVLLLNDDTEAETTDWLGRMAAHLLDPTVGAVGAALLYPDRTVQHVGMVSDNAHPLHPFVGYKLADTAGHGGDVARDVVGVTGACLLTRRRDLLAVGGMSLEFPSSYGDVDLCLRLRRLGLRVVVEPAAMMVHHESSSRTPIVERWEWDRFTRRWGQFNDPWYHPAYWRPNHPEHVSRNADHLSPVDLGAWPARGAAIKSTMHPFHMKSRKPPSTIHSHPMTGVES